MVPKVLTADAPVEKPTALGFGGASIGNLYAAISDVAATETVQTALSAGIGYFDTAPYYGLGLGERRLGDALAGHAARVSTKVGRRLVPVSGTTGRERHGFVDADANDPVFDYSYDGVMASFASSLGRLRRDRVDILLAHDLGRATHGDAHPGHWRAFLDGGLRAMVELKASGAVGAIGLGVNEYQVCEAAMAHAAFDVFLLAGRYTLLEQTALDSFLPACAARGIEVVVGGPYNSGILARPPEALDGARYDYVPAPPEVVASVAAMHAVCSAHGVPLAAAALQFPLAHPAVKSVIPGMANPAEVASAVALMAVAIPGALWDDLRNAGLIRADAPTPA